MELTAGQVVVFQHRFSQNDFDRFAALSRDHNPIHVDPEFSARTRFGRTVSHGMLLYGLISRGINALSPQMGLLQIEQEMLFRYPTYTETEISIRIEVLQFDPEHQLAQMKTTILLPEGDPACEGKALISLAGSRADFQGIDRTESDSTVPGSLMLKHLRIGQSAEVCRTFTDRDLEEYRDLTGDTNPLFTDSGFAVKKGFRTRLIPPPLLSGMFSDLLGNRLPGSGTNWLKQNLHFSAPAYVGDEVTARVEIIRLRPEKDLVNLAGTCSTGTGERVCRAQSLVLVRDMSAGE
ncbi:MAG: MaoC family dehydratase [Thermodesulfobacteriota bacterium]